MPKLSFSVGVRLELDVHQALIELAAADGRKLSSYIAKLCADHVRGIKAAAADPPIVEPAEDPPSVVTDPQPDATYPGEPQPVTDWMSPKRRQIRKR